MEGRLGHLEGPVSSRVINEYADSACRLAQTTSVILLLLDYTPCVG